MSQDTMGWFNYELTFNGVDVETISSQLKRILESKGFKMRSDNQTESTLSLGAMYGSKVVAVLCHMIPYIGRHLPAGKRCYLQVNAISEEKAVKVSLRATPYMELFDEEEMFPLTQAVDEKVTDEYFASHKLFKIIQDLYNSLNIPIPAQFEKLDIKPFAKDSFWRFLLYPLDGFRAPKPVYIPTEHGPLWCWGAFIVPELWFIWHEIWGASIFAIAIEGLIGWYGRLLIGAYSIVLGVITARTIAAIFGHRIYYLRYGRWLKQDVTQPLQGSSETEVTK